jgi:pre-rRNA-processing protein TSR4
LDLKNDIYTIDGESKIGRVKDHCIQFGEKNIGYCSVCGFKANQVCGHCHVKRYCSREHQQLDWSHGHHKQYCGKGDVPELVQKWMGFFRFPEFGLVQESESEKTIESITKEIEESLNVVEEGDDDLALEDETETEVDKQFLKFQKRIERDPEQVLRYSRTSPDENEEPLWVSDIGKDPEIPNCPCGSKRTFEFQV